MLHSCKRLTALDSDHDSSTILDEDVEMAEETKGEDRDYSSYKEIARIQSSLDSQCSKAPSCMTCHCVVEQGTLRSYFAVRTTENLSCMLTSPREAALICKDTVDQPTCRFQCAFRGEKDGDNRIAVPIYLEGEVFTAMLDTGCTSTSIDPKVAKKLKIETCVLKDQPTFLAN